MSGESSFVPDVPEEEEEENASSLYSKKSKQTLKDAMDYCENLLAQNNLITGSCSSVFGEEAMAIGEEIFENTVTLLGEKKLILDEKLILPDNEDDDNLFQGVQEMHVVSEDSQSDYEPKEKKIEIIRIHSARLQN